MAPRYLEVSLYSIIEYDIFPRLPFACEIPHLSAVYNKAFFLLRRRKHLINVGSSKSYAQRSQAKGMRGAVVTSVNMHRLGESFVEKVSDVRRRATVDGMAAAPGESLEFLAHIRGWQSEARRQRRDQLYNWVPVVPVTQGDRENKGVRLQTLAAAASASAPAELAGKAAIWQQMTDEASGKPYWSLTRCVLPDDRALLLPLPPHALALPAGSM